MKILWVATKPPWPPVDGGRVLQRHTLAALNARGHELVVVAPFDPAAFDASALEAGLRDVCRPRLVTLGRRSRLAGLALAVRRGEPVSIALHARTQVRDEVERLLAGESFDLVHAEQLQALASCAPALERGLPLVLRCQNVESDLWRGMARLRPLAGSLLRAEARRLERHEARAVQAATAAVALTRDDAGRLEAISGRRVQCIRAPFPAELPSAARPLAGAPAVVLLGGEDWLPNRDAARWFVRTIWPAVRAELPDAVLHRLRGAALADSRDAFPGLEAVLAVPLRIASGVRIKILEAWARGTPVVATPQAAAGLEARDGRELLVAASPAAFAAAVGRLHRDRALAEALVRGGRRLLRERHAPHAVAAELEALYGSLS